MRGLSIPAKGWRSVLAVVFLTMSGMSQACSHAKQTPSVGDAQAAPQPANIPSCNGVPSGSSAAPAPLQISPHAHSVTLSWNAATPASMSPRDAIKGYYVYRSLSSRVYAEGSRISESPVRGTRCVDTKVEAQKTYFYVIKAVTESGKQSDASIEIKAVVPFP